jgi:hypothetical protein
MTAMRTCGFYLLLAWTCLWLCPGTLSSLPSDVDWCEPFAPLSAEERRHEVRGDVPNDPETAISRVCSDRPTDPSVEAHALVESIRLRIVSEGHTRLLPNYFSRPQSQAHHARSPRAPPPILS